MHWRLIGGLQSFDITYAQLVLFPLLFLFVLVFTSFVFFVVDRHPVNIIIIIIVIIIVTILVTLIVVIVFIIISVVACYKSGVLKVSAILA